MFESCRAHRARGGYSPGCGKSALRDCAGGLPSRPACRHRRAPHRAEKVIDPWYDYLAFPIAPLVLVAQVVGLFLRVPALRLTLIVAGPLLIGVMLAYVSSLPLRADEGVNIGQGVLVLCLLASIALSVVALIFEGVRAVRSG